MTELDGESAFTEMSLAKRFCASPRVAKRERIVWETQRVADTKIPEGLVTSVRPICPTSFVREKKRKEETRRKKGSRIYVRKERSKTAKVRWHLLYSVRPMIAFAFSHFGEFIPEFISIRSFSCNIIAA